MERSASEGEMAEWLERERAERFRGFKRNPGARGQTDFQKNGEMAEWLKALHPATAGQAARRATVRNISKVPKEIWEIVEDK